MGVVRVTRLLPAKTLKKLDRNVVESIARGGLVPSGLRGTEMGGIIQRLAIEWMKTNYPV